MNILFFSTHSLVSRGNINFGFTNKTGCTLGLHYSNINRLQIYMHWHYSNYNPNGKGKKHGLQRLSIFSFLNYHILM